MVVAGALPNDNRANPRGYTGVCGSRARACAAWRLWPVKAHDMAHVPALDRLSMPRGNVPTEPTRTLVP